MTGPVLDDAAILVELRAERLALGDLVADLDDAGWATPSLCGEWTVRDVVAHLTVTTRWRYRDFALGALRARGDFDAMMSRLARDRAARFTPSELRAQLVENAASARRAPGSTTMDPLFDVVVHTQDVARPLGRGYVAPVGRTTAALTYAVERVFHGGPARVAGLRLVATDADWSHGSGAEVHGSAADLLVATAGRPTALDALAGPGVPLLARRLTP